MTGADGEAAVLVGTLHTDESQIDRCRASVAAQTYPEIEHVVFRDLPNREAHRTLYRSFMERGAEFDIFVKLDADMVLLHPRSLEEVVRLFEERPGLDHLELAVDDWMTRRLLMGLHVFSDRARWRDQQEDLYLDPDPVIPGEHIVLRGAPAPVARHAPDPLPFEGFRWGVSRGLKSVQPDRETFLWARGRSQWKLLIRAWKAFAQHGGLARGLALAGAGEVMTGRVGMEAYDHTSSALREHFEEGFRRRTEQEMKRVLATTWAGPVRRAAAYVRAVGPARWTASLLRELPGALRTKLARLARRP